MWTWVSFRFCLVLFCLLIPCPLWPGLAVSSPWDPCLPILVHVQDNPSSPAHTATHTVHSSYGHTAVLNWDLVCEYSMLLNIIRITPPRCPGLSWWLSRKESTCTAEDWGLIPGTGRPPEAGNGNRPQYSCLVNPMDGGPWWATVPRVARVRHHLATKPPPPRYCPIYNTV